MAEPARQFDEDDLRAREANPKPNLQVIPGGEQSDPSAPKASLKLVGGDPYDKPGNVESTATPGRKASPGVADAEGLKGKEETAGRGSDAAIGGSYKAGGGLRHEGQIGPGYKFDGTPDFLDRVKNLSRRKKAAIAFGVTGGIISIILAIFSFLPFEIIHIRHIVTDKIGGTEAHTYLLGRKKMYSTQFFFDQNGQYSGAKVGGVRRLMLENRSTKGMVAALQESGYQIEYEKLANGKQTGKIKALRKVDDNGNTIAEYTSNQDLQSAWSIRESGDLDGILKEVFPDKSDFWYNRATNQLYRRWGLTRTDIFKEKILAATGITSLNGKLLNAEQKFKLALRETLFGSNGQNSGVPNPYSSAEEEAVKNDPKATQDQKTLAEQTLGNSDALNQAYTEGESDLAAELKDPTNDGSYGATLKAISSSKDLDSAVSSLKGGLSPGNLAGSLSLLSTAEKGCTVNSTLNAIQMAARTMRAYALMKFSLSVLTVADDIQNGKQVPSSEVSSMMSFLNSKDSNGKGFFAASGVNFWNSPNSGNSAFASYDKSQRDQYSVGGGFTGTLAGIQALANKWKAGISCSTLQNPFVRAFGFAAGGVAAFFTAGTSVTLQVASSVSASVLSSFALGVAVHTLAPIVAGTVINGTEQGTAVGNAFVSGAETLTSANGAATGMRPLTKSEFKVAEAGVQADQNAEIAETPLAQRLFSPNVDSSITSTAAMGLVNFKASSFLTAPFASLGKIFSFGGLFGSPALAADNSSCPDSTIPPSLATTPFCNLIMGIPDSAMNNPAYAPDKIDDTINATTQNVDDYGNPIKNSPYYNYLYYCTPALAAEGSPGGGLDIIHTDENPQDPNAYTDRCTNDLFNIYYLYMTIGQGENDALTGNLGGTGQGTQAAGNSTNQTSGSQSAQTGSASGSQAATGSDAPSLAKDILANSNINLSGYSSSVLQDVQDAANNQPGTAGAMTSAAILQLIDGLGKTHKILVSAIQSNGTGHCTQNGVATPKSACPTDPHYNGDAVDFAAEDGQSLTGRDSLSLSIINFATSILPAGSGFGQKGCGGVSVTLPSGFIELLDSCNHLHVQVPAGTP